MEFKMSVLNTIVEASANKPQAKKTRATRTKVPCFIVDGDEGLEVIPARTINPSIKNLGDAREAWDKLGLDLPVAFALVEEENLSNVVEQAEEAVTA